MIPVNNRGEVDKELILLRIDYFANQITRTIRKQTAIDALARLNAGLANIPPKRFMMAGRQLGFTRSHMQWLWRVNTERAYLENVINEGWNG